MASKVDNVLINMGFKSVRRPRESMEQMEAMAMDTFRQRISSHRSSMPQYHYNRAPGFDYLNWKPHGQVRYHYRNNPDEYTQTCVALAPYVRSVVESGCQGQQERKWESMTVPSHQRQNLIRTGSREGMLDTSQDRI